MPHPEDPTHLSLDEQVLTNNTGNADVKDQDYFVDPRGQYIATSVYFTEADTDNPDAFKVENQGPDLRLVRLEVTESQGAENGRAHWNVGWDIDDTNAQYAVETFASHVGAGQGDGRHRSYTRVDFTEATFQPLFEFKDTMYLNAVADSDTAGDTIKTRAHMVFVPDEQSGGRL